MQTNNKIKIIATALLTMVAASGLSGCGKDTTKTAGLSKYEIATDLPEGSKDAKVVMVEYASVTCPHCARFGKNVMPEVRKNYIQTGKVRYVFREFPTAPVELASAGHLLGRCVDPSKRQAIIDTLMDQQENIYQQAQGPAGAKQAFVDIAKSAGMSEAQFDDCMKDSAKLKMLADIRQYALDHDKVTGTPTVFINGKEVQSPVGREYNFDDIKNAVEAELAKTK